MRRIARRAAGGTMTLVPADQTMDSMTQAGAVSIRLNGDALQLPAPQTIQQLLERLEIDPRRVAVEHNLVIIKRDRYASTMVADGDEIEVVNFVGGG